MPRFFEGDGEADVGRSSLTSSSTSSSVSTAPPSPNEGRPALESFAFDVPTANAMAQRFKDSVSSSRSSSVAIQATSPLLDEVDEVDEMDEVVERRPRLQLLRTASLPSIAEPLPTHSLAASGPPLSATSRLAREHQVVGSTPQEAVCVCVCVIV